MQITVNGRKVTVGDNFATLPRDQQDKTVDEIAAAMNAQQPSGGLAGMLKSGQMGINNGSPPGPAQPVAPPAPTPDVSQNPQHSSLPGVLGQAADWLTAATVGGMNASTLNMGDELLAGGQTVAKGLTGNGWDYGGNLAQNEQITADTRALNPGAYDAGSVAGGFALLGKPGAFAAPVAATKWMIPKAAAAAGAYGAVNGFGEPGSLQERFASAAKGGAAGAVVGGLVGTGAKALASPSAKAAVPTVPEIFKRSKAAFKAAESSGAVVPQASMGQYAQDLYQMLQSKGLVTPSGKVVPYADISHALNLVDDFAKGDLSIQQAMTLRETLARAAGSANPKERLYGKQMLDQFDNFIETALPPGVANMWATARAAYHTGKKAETVEALITRAERKSKGAKAVGIDASLRNRFGTFVDKEKNLRGYTPQEKAQITQVAEGTRVGNAGKMVGGLAPSSLGGLTFKGGVPIAIGTAMGSPILGGAAAGLSLAAGYAGRIVANMSSRNQAALASLIVRNGGKLPTKIPAMLPPEMKKALGNLIIVGGPKAEALGQYVLQMLSSNQATATPGQ